MSIKLVIKNPLVSCYVDVIAILHSHTEKHFWVSSNERDEPKAYYTEWSNSERERQISYINAHIWNQIILCAGQQRRHRYKEQTFGHSRGRRG